MEVSPIISKLNVVRYVRYEYLNGLIHQSKNSPKHKIVDQIIFSKGRYPKKYKASIRTITENVPDKFKINKNLSFGDQNYEHYYDKIGLYHDLDHLDEDRRTNFLNRFKDKIVYPSAAWFSAELLW